VRKSLPCGEQKRRIRRTEVLGKSSATDLAKPVGAWGYVSAVDCEGRTIWIADAHRDDGKRYIVRAAEKLTAFVELESQLAVKEKACFASAAADKTKVLGEIFLKNQGLAPIAKLSRIT